jgi:hypothetical protein
MTDLPDKPREVRAGTRRPTEPDLPPVPVGLHKLLRLAAVDPGFRARLVAQRDEAAAAAGVRLTASERAILRAVPAGQLDQLAERMPPPRPEQATRLRQIAANAVLLLGGAALLDGVACRKSEPAATAAADTVAAVVSADAEFDEQCRRRAERLMESAGGTAPDLPDCYPPPPMRIALDSLVIDGPVAEFDVQVALVIVTTTLQLAVDSAVTGMEGSVIDPCDDRAYRERYEACPAVVPAKVKVTIEVKARGAVGDISPQFEGPIAFDWERVESAFQSVYFPPTDAPWQLTATWSIRPGD